MKIKLPMAGQQWLVKGERTRIVRVYKATYGCNGEHFFNVITSHGLEAREMWDNGIIKYDDIFVE